GDAFAEVMSRAAPIQDQPDCARTDDVLRSRERLKYGEIYREPEGRGQRAETDRRASISGAQPMGGHSTAGSRRERVPQDSQLAGIRLLAPGVDRGGRRRDESALRVRVWRLPSPPSHGPTRLLLPSR